jgi:hypothetical protein
VRVPSAAWTVRVMPVHDLALVGLANNLGEPGDATVNVWVRL